MNAGRDVERLIATWLVEESPGRAPDRILANAAGTIDRTRQRRFLAAWREPVSIGLRGFAASAAVLILALIGAAWIGRSTASVGTGPSQAPATSPAATPASVTLAQYRAAFAAVCASITRPSEPGPSPSPAELVAFLQATIAMGNDEAARFEALQPPPDLVTDHLANIQTLKDVLALLNHEIELIQANKLDEVATVDESTGSLNRSREQFAAKYGLSTACP
jgi:hypothetical protein